MEPITTACIWTGPIAWSLGWGYERLSKIFTDRQLIASAAREGWTHIGTVKFMCIYPIDGGRAIKAKTAYFGENGLQTYDFDKKNRSIPMHVYDRGYVIYSNSNPPTAILNDNYVIRADDKSDEIRVLWKLLRCTTNTLTGVITNRKSIDYLNGGITLRIPSDIVFNQVKKAYNLPSDRVGGIGFYPQIFRKRFNDTEKRRLQNSAERFKPNYASFTMVNTKSVKDLKRRTGRSDLSYRNFRPQIVFDGKRPYIEENINALRIGNMEFSNVTPCARGEEINLHFKLPTKGILNEEVIQQNPYEYLTKYRSFSKLRAEAYKNLKGAVFGTNFDSKVPDETLEATARNGAAVADEDAIGVAVEDVDAIQVEAALQNEDDPTDPDDTIFYRNKFIKDGTLIFAKYDS